MTDNLLQNIDTPQDNPTMPEAVSVSNKTPKDPKIIVLIIFISILAILAIIAIIVSSTNTSRGPVRKTKISPTPTPIAETIGIPTITTNQLPEEFQTQFNEIEKELNKTENLAPPQIDIDIGIIK